MRITTGKFKGRNIKMPKHIRPTQNKVRKAIFDILGDIVGLSFLDLFAGSGAIGLEALSRGVGKVVFVESNKVCIRIIKYNLFTFELKHRPISTLPSFMVIWQDTERALRRLEQGKERFDIIFLDPPYYQDLAKKTLKSLSLYDILAPNGIIICQHFKRDILPEEIESLRLIKQAKYGDTFLSFYKKH